MISVHLSLLFNENTLFGNLIDVCPTGVGPQRGFLGPTAFRGLDPVWPQCGPHEPLEGIYLGMDKQKTGVRKGMKKSGCRKGWIPLASLG
jgi:hypothetical protein